MSTSDRSLNGWFRRQPASEVRTLSEMPLRGSGVDSAWQYGLACLAKDRLGGV